MKLSVCMIVKNEQEILERCLNCVKKFADEIIIVDTGSSDKTVSIAKQFTDKVYHFDWCDDFAKARNFSFEKASLDYICWLDADDFIDEENIKTQILKQMFLCANMECVLMNKIIHNLCIIVKEF